MIKAAGFSDIALAIRHRFARGTRLTLSFAAGDITRNEIESCSLSLSLSLSREKQSEYALCSYQELFFKTEPL